MAAPEDSSRKNVASNRRALHDYFILEHLEAGVALLGSEAKSLRDGHASLVGSFARIDNGSLWLHNFNIPTYEFANRYNHDPVRPRRLLLHRREIDKLQAQSEQKGLAIIPMNVYFRRGIVKVDLAVCKGKQQQDKRETLRRKTADRDAQRAIAARR